MKLAASNEAVWRVLANDIGGSKDVGITSISYKIWRRFNVSQLSQEKTTVRWLEQLSFSSNWSLVLTCLSNVNSSLVNRCELWSQQKRIWNEWEVMFWRDVHIYFRTYSLFSIVSSKTMHVLGFWCWHHLPDTLSHSVKQLAARQRESK